MAGALDDARARDDALRGHRIGGCDPLDPRDGNERDRQEKNRNPDGRKCPVARVLGDVEGTYCGGDSTMIAGSSFLM